MKLIIDFECENDEVRKMFIKPSYEGTFGKLVRENKFEVIDEFMEKVLSSYGEVKKWFKNYSEWHSSFIEHCDLKALDNLLIWQ